MHFNKAFVATALLASFAVAHPGHDVAHEAAERAAGLKHTKKNLDHCSENMKARGVEQRTIDRRAALLKSEREKRGLEADAPMLKARDLDSVLNTSHSSSIDYTPYSPLDTFFSGNASCILSPEVTQGPYYVSGEYIRNNLIEDQVGVPLVLDIQVIDMSTCEPLVDVMFDIWACNSTGVYGGITARGNGDANDTSNLDNTFFRGLQATEYDGVTQFTTIFPGHYTSRATHIHVLTHTAGDIIDNATYISTNASHVGQLFFDQDLITQVEKTYPYYTNTQELTLNVDDGILGQEANGSDPIVEYSFLGDKVEDGIFAWISFGIDLTVAPQEIVPAAFYGADGGQQNPAAPTGGGGPPPNSSTVLQVRQSLHKREVIDLA